MACDSGKTKSKEAKELSYKTLKGTWRGEVSISLNHIKSFLKMELDNLSDSTSSEQKEKATRVINDLIDFLYDVSDGNSVFLTEEILLSVISENELSVSVNVKMNEKEFQKLYSSEENATRFITILLGEEEVKECTKDGGDIQDYAKDLIDLYVYVAERSQKSIESEGLTDEKTTYEIKNNTVILLNDEKEGINLVLEYNQQRDSLTIQNTSEIEARIEEIITENADDTLAKESSPWFFSLLQTFELKRLDDSQQVNTPTVTNALLPTYTLTTAPTLTPTITAAPTKTPTVTISESPSPTKAPVSTEVNTHRTSTDNVNVEQYLNGYYRGYVKTDSAAVYTGPGAKDYPHVTLNDGTEVVLSKDTEVLVWGEAKDRDLDVWYHITATVNNQQIEGYVYIGRVNRENTQIISAP